ncbi:MAG: group II intron reverse transcriptase/maturase, partial [Fusobacteriaceae bacterium]
FFREGLNNKCFRGYKNKYLYNESRNRKVLSVKIRWNRRITERMQSIEITSVESKSGVENSKTNNLLEKALTDLNIEIAMNRVIANGGSHGIDNMTVSELPEYFKKNGNEIKRLLRERKYRPSPVRRVEIPKPDGGVRLLGIPTAIDRVIQQAINQVLVPIYEKKFSDNSFGFRRSRNAKMAIKRCKEYIEEGYTWVVDIDLEKYFDTVNHDKLMKLIHNTIEDGDLLSIIRKYLTSGVEIDSVKFKTEKGCPQGGPLSPMLSNIMLNELDIELEKRGLKFCRYADDCNIYVKSKKSAERVMGSITNFIENKLKLKVNQNKSKVDRPWNVKFLGFSFYRLGKRLGVRVHPKPVEKFKEKLKRLTSRRWSVDMEYRVKKLNQSLVGWVSYFCLADMKILTLELDGWLRRRIRMCYWKQWKKIRNRQKNLVKLGIKKNKAWEYANTRKSYWRTAGSFILSTSLTNEYLSNQGLKSINERYQALH